MQYTNIGCITAIRALISTGDVNRLGFVREDVRSNRCSCGTTAMSMTAATAFSPCVCFISQVPAPISQRISIEKGVCSGCGTNSLQINPYLTSIRLVPRANALSNLQLFPPYGNGAPGFTWRSAIVWFQTNDLRLHDHPALMRALETHDTVIPMFIFPETRRMYNDNMGQYCYLGDTKTGQYSPSFLLDSVRALKKSLRNYGSDLLIKKGENSVKVLLQTARALRVNTVFFHTPPYYSPRSASQPSSQSLEQHLQDAGIDAQMLWAGTLHSLSDFCGSGSADNNNDNISRRTQKKSVLFRNFAQFREYVHRNSIKHQQPLDAPASMPVFPAVAYHHSEQLPKSDDGHSKPSIKNRRVSMLSKQGGESVALDRLSKFLAHQQQAASQADFSVRIIPWLSSGCLSPRRLYTEMRRCTHLNKAALHATYLELIWRDFFRFLPHFSASSIRSEGRQIKWCT